MASLPQNQMLADDRHESKEPFWHSANGFRATLITRHFLQPSECLKRAYTGNEPASLPLGPCKQRRWQVRAIAQYRICL